MVEHYILKNNKLKVDGMIRMNTLARYFFLFRSRDSSCQVRVRQTKIT
jgi:hypothetical protein